MVAVFCVFVPFSFFPTIIESLTRAMLSIGNPLRNIAKNPTMTHLAKKKSRKKNFFFLSINWHRIFTPRGAEQYLGLRRHRIGTGPQWRSDE